MGYKHMNKRSNGKMKYRMLSILGLVIFFGVWEAAVRLGWVSHRSLNAPSEVVETFIYKLTNANPDGSTLPQHFFQSLKLALTSFIIATIIGVPLGWIMGYYKVADFQIMRQNVRIFLQKPYWWYQHVVIINQVWWFERGLIILEKL